MAVAAAELRHIEEMLDPSIEAMGYQLVQLRWLGEGRQRTLQIMAERHDEAEMQVADCTDLSRAISAILDVEDPLPGAYLLEVGSPGLDRPLVRATDYKRFAGREAKIELHRMVAGQRRFKGTILGYDGVRVQLAVATRNGGEQLVEIPYVDIEKSKLIVTDAVIQESLKKKQRKKAK